MKPVLAITMGDYNGIGPEVILKSLYQNTGAYTPLLIGHPDPFKFYAEKCDISFTYKSVRNVEDADPGKINLLQVHHNESPYIQPGQISAHAGSLSMKAVESGIRICMNNKASALVTAPVSKEAIALAGYDVPGHTEFLAQQTGTEFVLMILVSGNLRVALTTGHIPVRKISEMITQERILKSSRLLYKSLKDDFSIDEPKIAVLGLNPHSGDGGVIGMEEIEIIEPSIRKLRAEIQHISGPFAADGFFGQAMYKQFHGLLAMYHDQGLAPFKALSFGTGVNFTAGLPVIRTSPDHGTAFAIAGKNRADHQSFLAACKLAVNLSNKKSNGTN